MNPSDDIAESPVGIRQIGPSIELQSTSSKRFPTNTELYEMLQEQRDVISMMQIQLDLQKERLDKQDKEIISLKSELKGSLKRCGNFGKEQGHSTITVEAKIDWKPESPRGGDETSVADLVKQAAEEIQAQQTDYIYDEKSGLYYDKNSGYYYDPAQGLFYNGHTRTYYKWDSETKSYTFHSQLPDPPEKEKKKRRNKHIKSKKIKVEAAGGETGSKNSKRLSPTSPLRATEVEEGELSDSSESSAVDNREGSDSDSTITSQHSTSTASSRLKEECLPCIRAVVMESPVVGLTKGFLFVITVMGGSIGREGSMHSILISDPHVSKHHADIHYSSEDGKFYLTDMGSQSGTFLNGRRLSDARVTSDVEEVLHGSTIKIGATTLLIHIHPGSLTCATCEPGLNAPPKEPLYGPPLSKEKKEALRKKQLKKLRRKYGVEPSAVTALASLPDNYTDRAQERRKVKGSDNPYEKTQVASVDESIKETNKGFKMLSKMGWKSGMPLGPSPSCGAGAGGGGGGAVAAADAGVPGDGRRIEPIKVELLPQRVGLGYETASASCTTTTSTGPAGGRSFPTGAAAASMESTRLGNGRAAIMEKTLKRYRDVRSVTDADDDDDAGGGGGVGGQSLSMESESSGGGRDDLSAQPKETS